MTQKLLIPAILALLMAGCNISTLLTGKLNLPSDASTASVITNSQTEVASEPPADVMNSDGTINQQSFEQSQQVTSDTSLDTIDSELNSTVILNEDFSDL